MAASRSVTGEAWGQLLQRGASADTPPICIAGGAGLRIAGPGGFVPFQRRSSFSDRDGSPWAAANCSLRSACRSSRQVRAPVTNGWPCVRRRRWPWPGWRPGWTSPAIGSAKRGWFWGGGPAPMLATECGRLLAGERPDEDSFARAADAAAEEARPYPIYAGRLLPAGAGEGLDDPGLEGRRGTSRRGPIQRTAADPGAAAGETSVGKSARLRPELRRETTDRLGRR